MSLSNWLENKILDKVYRNVDFTVSAVYVQLHTADPGEDCTNLPAAELGRQVATFGSAAASGAISNTADVDWLSVVSNTTITHLSLWDASTSGNPLGSGPLASPVPLTIGDNFKIPAGDLDGIMD